MATIVLGRSEEFDVNCDEIQAVCCGVTAADCAALAARIKSGEISRVKTLNLVRFILLCFSVLNWGFLFYGHARGLT
jgi:hypothetical protein